MLGWLQDLEKMVQQARRESVKADDLVRSLTPRPNWHKLDAFAAPASGPAPGPGPAPGLGPTQATAQSMSQRQAPTTASAPSPAGSSQQPPQQQQQQAGLPLASTRDLVQRLAAERKQALVRLAELEPLQLQLQQAKSLLEPDAAPCAVQLQLVEANSAQSQTPAPTADVPAGAATALVAAVGVAAPAPRPVAAAAGSDAARSSKTVSISTAISASAKADTIANSTNSNAVDAALPQALTGLGWGNAIPRYLRWDSSVVLQHYSLEGLYSTLQDIWAGKAAFDRQRQAQCPLSGFLWTYLRAEHGEQQGLVAQAGYSFLYALQQHQHHLAIAAVFLKILEGQWQEAHWHDCRHMVDAVALVLEALGELHCTSPCAASNQATRICCMCTLIRVWYHKCCLQDLPMPHAQQQQCSVRLPQCAKGRWQQKQRSEFPKTPELLVIYLVLALHTSLKHRMLSRLQA